MKCQDHTFDADHESESDHIFSISRLSFTFEERLFARMFTFANAIVGNGSSPRNLKELIKEKSIDEEISDFGSYALRSGTAKKSEIIRTQFGHLTYF